jgi:hypothetical protein
MKEELSNYEGQIKDGKLHGKGKITNSKLSIEGTFKEGVLDGQAIILLTNGEKYQILIEDGKLIEKKLLEGSKINISKKKPRNPYQPGPGPNPRPKGSHFFLPGLDI